MKTIDELLSQISEVVDSAPPKPAKAQTKREGEPANTAAAADAERGSESGIAHSAPRKIQCGAAELYTKPVLPLAIAKEIAYCVECGADMMNVKVVTAIVNDSGMLMYLSAMDDSYPASVRAAQDKAYTAAALKMPTHIALKESRGGALDGYTNGNGILMLGGGYPIESDGKVIGGIGVSGGSKEQDMILAKIGKEYFSQRVKTKGAAK